MNLRYVVFTPHPIKVEKKHTLKNCFISLAEFSFLIFNVPTLCFNAGFDTFWHGINKPVTHFWCYSEPNTVYRIF